MLLKKPEQICFLQVTTHGEKIYIPAWQIYENIFLNGPYHVTVEARLRELAVTLPMLASWRQYKEVYRFAPEMEDLLYKQADLNLPLDVLRNLQVRFHLGKRKNILVWGVKKAGFR